MPRLVKIRSWHRIRTVTRVGTFVTLCGRLAPSSAATADEFGEERSCESCLRIESQEATA